MKGYRAALLRFDPAAAPQRSAVYDTDGLLVVGPDAAGKQVVQAAGDWASLAPRFPGEHNAEVFGERLGLDAEALDALAERGVI